eukprot:gnl/Dysnectes_brevis/5491_a7920_638.p1 GENE.gnl/Dysnectes_brevis/5491_a7920_638~~gnl/Dysnectes_brevis/5491_a7920_638.p1  ORF type:complete len:158 (+),score=13.53 gnl/Dysnectes_brevis/5491_a7920_638:68-541(+)
MSQDYEQPEGDYTMENETVDQADHINADQQQEPLSEDQELLLPSTQYSSDIQALLQGFTSAEERIQQIFISFMNEFQDLQQRFSENVQRIMSSQIDKGNGHIRSAFEADSRLATLQSEILRLQQIPHDLHGQAATIMEPVKQDPPVISQENPSHSGQ